MNPLIETITSSEPRLRDRSIQDLLAGLSTPEVLRTLLDELSETFRQDSRNLYERVRASIFPSLDLTATGSRTRPTSPPAG